MGDEDPRLAAIDQAIDHLVSVQNDIMAGLSAQRFLLEQVYAQAYAGDPAAFEEFMQEALRRTRNTSAPHQKSGPMSDEQMLESAALIATQLDRFRLAVADHIATGRGR